MGSTRLPGKVMLPLAGQPVIWHIFDRLRRVRQIETVVLATTVDPRNDAMSAYAESQGMQVYRHHEEEDIAGRLAGVVAATGAGGILKVNADCPVVDAAVLQQVADRFLAKPGLDAASNKQPFTWPLGMSTEAFSARAIEWCNRNLSNERDREFVASWILKHPEQFKSASIATTVRYTVGDLLLDDGDDYRFFTELFNLLYRPGQVFGLAEISALMSRQPA